MTEQGGTTLIVGLGVTGMSCVRHLAPKGPVHVVDTRPEPPELATLNRELPQVPVSTGVKVIDPAGISRVVVSPGVALDHPLLQSLPDHLPRLGDIDLFFQAVRGRVIGVTGTNGKSTVAALTAHLLEAAGVDAVAGGNLGEPALDLLEHDADVYVLELSSFQLERMGSQPFAAATILNVSEDHLDRHGDLGAYTQAKQRIYARAGVAVVNRHDPATRPQAQRPMVSFGADAPGAGHWGVRDRDGDRWLAHGGNALLPVAELPLAGAHNELNVLAAMALARVVLEDAREIGEPEAMLVSGIRSFSGLPHRCQTVGRVADVLYVDDSKATNVGAALAALEGLGAGLAGDAGIVLIAGGDGKGADFRPLREAVRKYVKAAVLFGRDAGALACVLDGCTRVVRVADMDAAVGQAADMARAGDLVLLSPACASLDMYPNFAERGRHFARAVGALVA